MSYSIFAFLSSTFRSEIDLDFSPGVGLDTVAFIEKHYIAERGLPSEKTVDFLQRNYLDHGKLGSKSPKGGLYEPSVEVAKSDATSRSLLVLDLGLSSKEPSFEAGEILQISVDGQMQKVLTTGQALPDGVVVDPSSKRVFWTNMGVPGKEDGAVLSANLDGTDVQTIVAPGAINTPKQLALDAESKKLYFCDREGLRVIRCNFDGTGFEVLIETGDPKAPDAEDVLKWCVGIAVAPSLGKFYWTQKGPSKGGKGRIFCANISTPEGKSASTRDDIQCILSNLPEPVDLEIEEETRVLYWTDRGEIPFGNSLNRLYLDHFGLPLPHTSCIGYDILSRNLNEAIGLKLDIPNNSIYLTDLGGNLYRCDRDGKNRIKLFSDENRALTGIALV